LFEEILLIAAFVLAGAISGVVILNRISRSKTSLKKKGRFIKPYSTTKEELQSLQFEKSLISQSITRVYEASYESEIDLIERDRLLLKYKQQLDSYDKKIADLQSLVDISELADMRNGLVSLLEGRITAIDHKLTEISNKYGISTSDIIIDSPKSSSQQSIFDRAGGDNGKKRKNEKKEEEEDQRKNDYKEEQYQSDLAKEKVVTDGREQIDQKKDNAKEKVKTEEKTIDEIQKEIMQALGRLEQMDPDNSYGDHEPSVINNNNNNNKKRDALSSF
jgi:hypothetical protein